ncbi:MAG: hypothetical protein JSV93_05025, partial [Candidatus Omnitrophota bacterium]
WLELSIEDNKICVTNKKVGDSSKIKLPIPYEVIFDATIEELGKEKAISLLKDTLADIPHDDAYTELKEVLNMYLIKHEDVGSNFEVWLDKVWLNPKSLSKEIKFLKGLDVIIAGLSNADKKVRRESAEAIISIIETGALSREEVRGIQLLDPLISNLTYYALDVCEECGNAIKLLIERGIYTSKEVREKLPSVILDALNAGYLKFLIKTGIVSPEEVRNKQLLDFLLSGFGLGIVKSVFIRRDCADTINFLIKTKGISGQQAAKNRLLFHLDKHLIDEDMDVRNSCAESVKLLVETGVYTAAEVSASLFSPAIFITALKISEEHEWARNAKIIKFLIEAEGFTAEEIRAELPLDMLDTLIAALSFSGESVRTRSAEAIKYFVEAGIYTAQEVRDKLPLVELNTLFANLINNSNPLARAKSAEGIKYILEAGIYTAEEVGWRLYPNTLFILIARLTSQDAVQCERSAEALKYLIEAGIYTSGEVGKMLYPYTLNTLLDYLSNPDAKQRAAGAQTLKYFVEAGVINREEIRGFEASEIEAAFPFDRIDKTALGKYNFYSYRYYFLKLLENLMGDKEAVYRIFNFIREDFIELSLIFKKRARQYALQVEDYFYLDLAQFIKGDKSIQEKRLDVILEKLQERLARACMPELGAFIAIALEKGYKICSDKIKQAFSLLSIELKEEGTSRSKTSAIAEHCIMHSTLRLKELPVAPPQFRSRALSDIPVKDIRALKKVLKGAILERAVGRTSIYKNKNGKYFGVKLLKTSKITRHKEVAQVIVEDPGKLTVKLVNQHNGAAQVNTEDPGKLIFKSEYFDYLNRLKEEGIDLWATYPKSVLIGGERVVRISSADIPPEMKEKINEFQIQSKKPNEENVINATDGYNTMVVYVSDTPDCFSYLHEAEDDRTFDEASEKNIHDLFVLARYAGNNPTIHPDIIELFHNFTIPNRPDTGIYLWMVDIIRDNLGRIGAGRLNTWESATDYPNMRFSGPMDFDEMVGLNKLSHLTHPHSFYMQNNLQRFSIEDRKKFLLAHFMGNYLLAWLLNKGKQLKRTGKLDWKNLQQVQKLAKSIQKIYSTAYKAFTGEDDADISNLVDWEMYARQVLFFMGGAYKDYANKKIPREIFGIPDVRITPCSGWGRIHERVIEDKLGVRGRKLEKAINTYFSSVGTNMFVFKNSFPESIKLENNPLLRSKLEALYKKYSGGWHLDGVQEYLGPATSGPLPLTKLINGNYIYIMSMIAKGAGEPGELRNDVRKDERPEDEKQIIAREYLRVLDIFSSVQIDREHKEEMVKTLIKKSRLRRTYGEAILRQLLFLSWSQIPAHVTLFVAAVIGVIFKFKWPYYPGMYLLVQMLSLLLRNWNFNAAVINYGDSIISVEYYLYNKKYKRYPRLLKAVGAHESIHAYWRFFKMSPEYAHLIGHVVQFLLLSDGNVDKMIQYLSEDMSWSGETTDKFKKVFSMENMISRISAIHDIPEIKYEWTQSHSLLDSEHKLYKKIWALNWAAEAAKMIEEFGMLGALIFIRNLALLEDDFLVGGKMGFSPEEVISTRDKTAEDVSAILQKASQKAAVLPPGISEEYMRLAREGYLTEVEELARKSDAGSAEKGRVPAKHITKPPKMPPGSIPGVFKYLCDKNITSLNAALTGQQIADRLSKINSYTALKDDFRALCLHLHLIERDIMERKGKNAGYFVPERIRNKAGEILLVLSQFTGKNLHPKVEYLRRVYRKEILPILELKSVPKEQTRIGVKTIFEVFKKGHIYWGMTTKKAKLHMVKKLAKACGKEPGALATSDFFKEIPQFLGKSLEGLLNWAKREFKCKNYIQALKELKKYLGIKEITVVQAQDIDVKKIFRLFKKGRLLWGRATKKAKLHMVKKLAKACGKEPGALTTSDFFKEIPQFSGKSLGGLLKWAMREFKCKDYIQALKELKKHLGIKEITVVQAQDIDVKKIFRLFKKGYFYWSRATKEAKLHMVKKLAKACGKEPGALTTGDFFKKIPQFSGKSLAGLLYWARREFKCTSDAQALRELKKYLGIEDLILQDIDVDSLTYRKSPKTSSTSQLFEIVETAVNNKRTEFVTTANQLVSSLAEREDLPARIDTKKLDKESLTAEIKGQVERIIAIAEQLDEEILTEDIAAYMSLLKKNLDQFEADGIIASIIAFARRAKKENQNFVIPIELDWIPGYSKETSYQNQAIKELVGEIESIPEMLESMGLDSVKVILKGRGESESLAGW